MISLKLNTYLLGLLSVFFLLNSYIWAIVSPIGSGIDDDFHLPSVWCAFGDKSQICETVIEGDGFVRVPTALVEIPQCLSYQDYKSASCVDEIINNENSMSIGRSNELGRFPNIFYEVHHYLIADDIEESIILMRILNAVVFLSCLIFGFYILTYSYRWNYLLVSLLLASPFTLSIVVSNNPSSWLISSMSLLYAILFSITEPKSNTRLQKSYQLFGLLICFLLAISSRSEGSLFVSAILLTFLVIFFTRIYPFAKIFIITLILLGFYLTFKQPSTLGFSTGLSSTGPPSDPINWFFSVISNFPRFFYGVFGSWGYGWLDFEIPTITYFFYIVFFVGLFIVNLSIIQTRLLLFSLMNFVLISTIVLRVMYLSSNLVGVNIQPRYILPFLFPVVGSLLVFIVNFVKINLNYLISFIVLVSIAYGFSLHYWIQHFTAGSDNFSINLSSNFEWWWNTFLLPTPIWIFSTLLFTMTLFLSLIGSVLDKKPYLAKHEKV